MDFVAEEALIDKYVEIKDSGQGEPIIVELITKHFLPFNRFEEARSWRNAILDKELKNQVDAEIKEKLKTGKIVSVSRMPQNVDWIETSPFGPADTTDDQQYHYDRVISYFNTTADLLDDIEDVKVCRNEWITFVARNMFTSGMQKRGALMETLCMGLSDYIEMILIPNNFIEVEESHASQHPPQSPIEKAYANRPDVVSYLQSHAPALLKDEFLMNFYCQLGIGGKGEEIIVSDSYVAFLPRKLSGWGAGEMQVIQRDSISSISVGTEYHTEYQGITSYSETYWTLTFVTNNYAQFTRWLYLGRNEKEMNQNRPIHGKTLDRLQDYFDLEQGDSFQSSSGYTTSFGVGWWV